MWFRHPHKSRTHPTRCLRNRRTGLRCQALHRRHTRPPHCLRSHKTELQCPVLRKRHIRRALRMNRRRQAHWGQSCMPLGLCNQDRSSHRPHTHRIRLPRCPHNRRTDPRCQVRHTHRIRLPRCPRNRKTDPQCLARHKHRTHRAPGRTHRPPRPLGQSCKRQDRCNLLGKSIRHHHTHRIRLQRCPRNRTLLRGCRDHRKHRTRLRRCLRNRTYQAMGRCNRTRRQHRDRRTRRIRPIPDTSRRRRQRRD